MNRTVIARRASRKQLARRNKAKTRAFGARHRSPLAVPAFRDEFAATVERMTNRQRTRWARAKYQGLRGREVEPLWAFVAPPLVKKPLAPRKRKVVETA